LAHGCIAAVNFVSILFNLNYLLVVVKSFQQSFLCVCVFVVLSCAEPEAAKRAARLSPAKAGELPTAQAQNSVDAAAPPDAGPEVPEHDSLQALQRLLFPEWDRDSEEALRKTPCHDRSCLFALRFAGDTDAAERAERIYQDFGVVLTAERRHVMDGGYRGMVQIIPKLPTGAAQKKHLRMRAFTLAGTSDAGTASPRLPYRFFPTEVRFFETKPKKTPSAYAIDTRIAYNLIGTLMQTEDSVVETMIHEVFHLNDQAHKDWSITALSGIQTQLIQKCGTRMDCLAPYAPGTTTRFSPATTRANTLQNS
jgi:hypothetical protein